MIFFNADLFEIKNEENQKKSKRKSKEKQKKSKMI
jgi:hypothetical protein